ncbi:TetR/AcrR family transcriptional regulator [Sphingobium sp.]|uniref:TetR/AcrR family transcriptional regulator n=1 Tax=Sphingobium sp. TaxID=1912891 RepID=UPI002C38AE45|nr:TetR/AcrR family transcriptional regulator [Sphingobium sp.]HUD92474.1 TetR/AcrR family transcriptional regulator [Sphingobium sp.]
MQSKENQQVGARRPHQARSRYKVELILEATIRLLEKDGLDTLTTNAIAAAAGVSIGTLYQYFANKEAILDTLADKEMAAMSERVLEVMADQGITTADHRITAVIRAVAASYGERHGAHRIVMAHSLSRGGSRLSPLFTQLIAMLSGHHERGAIRQPLNAADAFVMAHAFGGVLRAMISEGDKSPPQAEIEQALARLVVSFVG